MNNTLSTSSWTVMDTISTPSQWLMTATATLLTYYIASAIYYCYLHPLAKFPGPKSASISRLPFAVSAVKGQTYKWLDDLHARHGPIVRIAPGELTIVTPGAWQDIYQTRHQMPKDPHSMTPPLNNAHSLFTAEGETHTRIRRAFLGAFSDQALRDQSPIVESHVQLLIQRLRRECAKDTNLDLAKFYGYASLDIIADLTFGESFHGLEGDNEHEWIRAFFLGAKFGAVRNSLSYFYPLDRVFGWVFLQLTSKHRHRNWAFTEGSVTKRLQMGADGIERADFMTPIIGNVDDGKVQKGKGITRLELNTNSLAVLIAGCQLTTVLLATATYLLLNNPHTYTRLRDEVRSSFANEKEIQVSNVKSLSYLSAVVDETLRIHHPTPIHLPRVVPAKGATIDGHYIPGNVSGRLLVLYDASN
ncbi:hypothetical protein Daus18300_002475 [Diaporthe australafricana]|uniref:Cytochrome P450 n=1 Tax=Diaporthe australafricana TaxID=127596 RepID=A0ABR3XNC8_9PEZI